MSEDRDLERELECLARAVGATIPPDRMPGVLNCYRELEAAKAILRPDREDDLEPASVFRLSDLLKAV